MPQKYIAPNARSPIVGQDGVLTPEWQRYLNGIQELAALLGFFAGSAAGTPEGVVAAPIGSFYTRTDGGAGTVLYVKESGAATSTGWVAK